MSSRRTERLLNLVIALLATRRWLTKEQIRAAVPQYAGCESHEAFDRMFERDKEDLRELGIPLVTGSDSAWFEDETGYRIDQDAYALPDIDFTAAEMAVLGLASRVWQQASLAGPAARAMVKLQALGVETDEESLVGVEPRVRTAEPAFEPLYAATRDRAPVSFTYCKPNGETSERHVEPWAVTSRSRWWYLVGQDRDRDDARVFRLSRIRGQIRRIGRPGSFEIPSDLDPVAAVAGSPGPSDERRAQLRVRSGRGVTLRRRAVDVRPAGEPHPGWELAEVPIGDVEWLAEEIASHGGDIVVIDPPDLREAVIQRLRGALKTHPDALVRGSEQSPEVLP
ncbi:MAG TPA: WYL domain-containing protein [Kineosporiaceae bacterium]|nr:WYL domain-containing protein [Kineosporiaceae bacterium]